jgi:hypothetical protein
MQYDGVFTDTRALLILGFSITPAALGAALTVQEQVFSVPAGTPTLKTTDAVWVTEPPAAPNTLVQVSGARVSSATQITVAFTNVTAAANVPTAGVYSFLIARS